MHKKRILKFVLYIVCAPLVFAAVYLACAFGLAHITVGPETGTKPETEIFILTNGVHTDIVVPVRNKLTDWSREVRFSNTVSKDTTSTYLAMGWGDKGFYLETPTWADLKASVAFRAAFGLSTTAIHATFYKEMPVGKDCRRILISNEQYVRLIKYITDSFQRGPDGHFIAIATNANYGNSDAFYEAKGSYSMLHTCNSWANSALKSCGQKACLWTPFDSGIFSKYKE